MANSSAKPRGGTLVIVESPAKAKSIAKMLGAGFEVRASRGHVADLPERGLGVQVDADFAPEYEVKKDKKPVVDELVRAARGKAVLIATDPDREGEAIGWHVARLLALDPSDPLRVEFHEITPRVVREAVTRPRPIDQHLVDAQQARRVLDRLVGYGLSPLLALEFRRRSLSAGRVQSVALRILVDRENEIQAFVSQEYWSLEGQFAAQDTRFAAQLFSLDGQRLQQDDRFLITSQALAEQALARVRAVPSYTIRKVERKERKRSAAPPFTTSTLQQAASTRLGWTSSRTMRVAQRLYEGIDLPEGTVGLITYMRTDSVRVSQDALTEVRQFIPQRYGAAYLPDKPNFYATRKAANAQEAHEAIRPTAPTRTPDAIRNSLTEEEYRLYDLVWRRFTASQMTPAVYDQTSVTLEAPTDAIVFRASGSVLKFDGYLRAWGRDDGEEAENLLPQLRENEPAQLTEATPQQHFTEPPPRYTDASLVKILEELGVGRPSTYAPTVETLEKRLYLERQGRALKPTALGHEVVGWLVQHFPGVVAAEFTAQMETRLDEVEEGKAQWPGVVREFYQPFLGEVERLPRKQCKVCGAPMEVKVSRFGQFLGCSRYPECKYTERLEARAEAEPIGETCPKCHEGDLVRRSGRYGSFISCNRYPTCDYTRDESPSTGFTCPKCHSGDVVQRTSKRGKPYYRCNNRDCDFLAFDPLLDDKCPDCGWNKLKRSPRSRKPGDCSNPSCARYGGPDLEALSQKRATQAKGKKGKGKEKGEAATKSTRASAAKSTRASAAKSTRASAAKSTRSSAAKTATSWTQLEAHLPTLSPADAEVVRLMEGQQQTPEAVATALGMDLAGVKAAHKRAMFRLRMAHGRARKESTPT